MPEQNNKKWGTYQSAPFAVIITLPFAVCQSVICHFWRFLQVEQVLFCEFMQYCVLKIANCSGNIKAQRRTLLFKGFQKSSVHIEIEKSNIWECHTEALHGRKPYSLQKERLCKCRNPTTSWNDPWSSEWLTERSRVISRRAGPTASACTADL